MAAFLLYFLNPIDNFPPNVTNVVETSETDALQEGEVLFMQVGVTVTLEISAHDPNEDDEVFFTFNDTAPDGANISSGMNKRIAYELVFKIS